MGIERELGKLIALLTAAGGITITVNPGDFQIGAVELKNDSDDTRAKIGGGVAANGLRIVSATDDPGVVSLAAILVKLADPATQTTLAAVLAAAGATTGAKVVTDANGTLQQYLRGLVTLAAGPTTGAQTSVASSATDVSILAANAARKGAAVFNDSTATLYLLLANATSSATVFTIQIAAGSYYELPVCQGGVYTGALKGFWASVNGNARVTEWT